MKERAIKFLYAIDCYLLYMLSGVVATAGVVAYYSITAAMNYDIYDSAEFVDYISAFVSGKASVVLLISYFVIVFVMIAVFTVRRRSLAAYTGISYARPLSVLGAASLGAILNLIAYKLTPDVPSSEETLNAVLVLCVIIGPVVEELMFRGVLLKMFGSSCGIVVASLITSALFAVSHGGLEQMLYTFVLGVVLCIVRVSSTSLWSAIALHLSFNITGTVFMVYATDISGRAVVALAVAVIPCFIAACTGGRKLSKVGLYEK